MVRKATCLTNEKWLSKLNIQSTVNRALHKFILEDNNKGYGCQFFITVREDIIEA